MFEFYTERARRVLFFARYEASQFGSTTIETEHLLLGLLREDKNLINRFLHNRSSAESVRSLVEGRITVREKVPTSLDLPISDAGKRILAYAAEEAERLNHHHIGTEHLALGILREQNCMAAEILDQCGLKLNPLREELARTPLPQDATTGTHESRSFVSASPALPKSGVVPDAATATQIAEAIWRALYGADTVTSQRPLKAELKNTIWIVSGSADPEAALFAFILKADGRILSVGQGSANS